MTLMPWIALRLLTIIFVRSTKSTSRKTLHLKKLSPWLRMQYWSQTRMPVTQPLHNNPLRPPQPPTSTIPWHSLLRPRLKTTLLESRSDREHMQLSALDSTSQQIRRSPWKFTKSISLKSLTDANQWREKSSLWRKWSIRTLFSSTRSLTLKSTSS